MRTDPDFQRRYNHFWRVRNGATWRAAYYDLLERAKRTGTDFEAAVRAMHERTGRIEAAFAERYPNAHLSDVKMVDFVLWQVREGRLTPARRATASSVSRVPVGDAEARFRELVKRSANGEAFVITDGDADLAWLGPVDENDRQGRPSGLGDRWGAAHPRCVV